MDLVKLETARQIFAVYIASAVADCDVSDFIANDDTRHKVMDACVDAADRLCSKVGDAKGHPAETALEQLFDLLASHEDKVLVKWVKANAKVRGLKELCTYLGADRE